MERSSTKIEEHHERLDGVSYPKGFKEKDILPEEAKLIAIINAFECYDV